MRPFLFGDNYAVNCFAHAPAAPEAKDGNVSADTTDAGERIDDNVTEEAGAAEYGDLVNFVDGAINSSDNDWI